MNKLSKTILISITVLICLIISIIIFLGVLQKKDNKQILLEEGHESTDENVSYYDKLTLVKERYEFFDVKNCIDNYIETLKNIEPTKVEEKFQEQINTYRKEQLKKLYGMLGSEFIEKFDITEGNIESKFSKYYTINHYFIDNMQGLTINNDVVIYVINGKLLYDNKESKKYKFIIKKDASELNFSIYPGEYIEYFSKDALAVESVKSTKVKKTEYNKYKSDAYDEEYVCKYYFDILKTNISYDKEDLYKKMNDEYKRKRFPTLDEFKEYIEENKIERKYIKLNEYLVEEKANGIKDYVCKDQYDHIYIFRQYSINDYSIILDTYTLPNEKFNTEYAKASQAKKVMMNIDKFFQMINEKDYKTAYNCLSNSFKDNYFKTEESFKKYIKTRVFDYNEVKYKVFNDEVSGIYQYSLELINKENTVETKNLNIVMRLKEGTNFEIAFEI